MTILARYLERHLSEASRTVLVVNANVDAVSASRFSSHIESNLTQLQRSDVACLTAGIEELLDEPHVDKCTPLSAVGKSSVCFLLIDLSCLSLTADPVRSLLYRQPSPNNIASEIVRLRNIVESAYLSARTTAEERTEPPSNVGLPIMPVAVVGHSVHRLAVARLAAKSLNQQGLSLYLAKSEAMNQHSMVVYERWEPLSVVILAAGRSSRMGRSKQLEVVNGQPMVVRALTTALQSGAEKVVLVTGAYAEQILALLNRTELSAHLSLEIVHNPDYAKGQSATVKAAIAHLQATRLDGSQPSGWGGVVMMPVDQPFLTPLLIRKLFRLWRSGVQIVAPSIDGAPRGAPALFDRVLWPHMNELGGDVGAKKLLNKFSEQLVTVEAPANSLADIDSPADLPK